MASVPRGHVEAAPESRPELMGKDQIEPLVVIPPGGGTSTQLQRERQLRQLAATVALLDARKPASLARWQQSSGTPGPTRSPRVRAAPGRIAGRAPFWCTQEAARPPRSMPSRGTSSSSPSDGLSASSESRGRMREVFPVG